MTWARCSSRQGLFLPLFHHGFTGGLHLEQALGGRQRGLEARVSSAARAETPGIRRLKTGWPVHVPRGYGKADERCGLVETDGRRAWLRCAWTRWAPFGEVISSSFERPAGLCIGSGCSLARHALACNALARRWRALALSPPGLQAASASPVPVGMGAIRGKILKLL